MPVRKEVSIYATKPSQRIIGDDMTELEKKQQIICHFSHGHPLERISSSSVVPTARSNITTNCYGCSMNIFPGGGSYYYNCKTCPFFLHSTCFNMPRSIKHPADPNHDLLLVLATPPSSGDTTPYRCKACGRDITTNDGFSYVCAVCGDHYHILCSVLPAAVKLSSHSHLLKLEFAPPYDFQCDKCNQPGYSGWLYRCGLCDYDAHLYCAINKKKLLLLRYDGLMPRSIESNNVTTFTEGTVRRSSSGGFRHTAPDQAATAGSYCPYPPRGKPSTPFSQEDVTNTTTSSHQFSDSYFSIDIGGSYNHDHSITETSADVTVNTATSMCNDNAVIPYRSWRDRISYPHYEEDIIGNRLNEVALTFHHFDKDLVSESRRRLADAFKDRSDTNPNAQERSSGCSCWSKLLGCCFYNST